LPIPLKNLEKARAKLASLVHGEVHLFERGGLLVSYPEGGRPLLADLRLLRGSKKGFKSARALGRRSVYVQANKAPVLLRLDVPLSRLVEVTATIATAKPLTKTAHVALLVRTGKGRLESRGVSRGTMPVELSARGKLKVLLTMEPPEIPAKTLIRLALRVSGRGSLATLNGSLRSARGTRRMREPLKLGRRAKSVVLYVEGASVHVMALEVRGLVDAKALD
jgi:hypothetical protein